MNQKKLSAWKNIRNAGTVSLIAGWLGVAGVVIISLISFFLIIINSPVPSDDGGEPVSSIVFGVLLLFFAFFMLVFAVLHIVAGSKLRKPIANPKGWLIFVVIMGALGIGNIMGILTLIFGILGLSSYNSVEGEKPPKNL